jgi:hypothetical protein
MIEASINKLEGSWWFDLGLSYTKTHYHKKKNVFSIGFGFFTVYVRW